MDIYWEKSYALGGLGARSTFLMSMRLPSRLAVQNSMGFSPGTLRLLSNAYAESPQMARAVAGAARQADKQATAVEKRIVTMVDRIGVGLNGEGCRKNEEQKRRDATVL